jgi:hypothetical protein
LQLPLPSPQEERAEVTTLPLSPQNVRLMALVLPRILPEPFTTALPSRTSGYYTPQYTMPTGLPPAPSERSALGPSVSMAVHGLLDHDPEEDAITDGRKAKRELSQSKRAAQNRAAQVSRDLFRNMPMAGILGKWHFCMTHPRHLLSSQAAIEACRRRLARPFAQSLLVYCLPFMRGDCPSYKMNY